MTEVVGVTPQDAYPKVKSGQALLVCGYEDPEKCRAVQLEGGLSLQEFRRRRATLPKDQEIIFYCA
ncbi:MAG: ArsR family transcriptional regulator [Deltaproteobacteria bacterium]|nr:ArsR family transcriptional regulator [Deltaproteobacteria bacterium]